MNWKDINAEWFKADDPRFNFSPSPNSVVFHWPSLAEIAIARASLDGWRAHDLLHGVLFKFGQAAQEAEGEGAR